MRLTNESKPRDCGQSDGAKWPRSHLPTMWVLYPAYDLRYDGSSTFLVGRPHGLFACKHSCCIPVCTCRMREAVGRK